MTDAPPAGPDGLAGRSNDLADVGSLLHAAPEALIGVRDGLITASNRRADDLAGQQLTGRLIVEVLSGWHPTSGVRDAWLDRGGGDPLAVAIVTEAADDDGLVVCLLRDANDTREAHAADEARKEAEARYQTLVEQIPAVVYIDVEGRGTTYVSPQVERILGVTPQVYCQDGADTWAELLHPDDRERVEREYEAFVAGRGGDLSDYRMCTPDGRVVWIRDRAVTVRDEHDRVLLEHGVMFDITEMKEAEAEISHLAYHDQLTGLANRRLFEETLDLAIHRAIRNDHAVAVLFLDLDNFKLVNDSLGHAAGDRLLIELADRLRICIRETDIVARQGGDEFLMLLADLERGTDSATGVDLEEQDAELVAGRIAELLRAPFDLEGTEFYARGSIGISLFPRDALDGATLLKNADGAMYRAKRFEPGGHVFFAGTGGDAMARLSFATRLRQAVEHEDWVLHYQPVVDLSDGRMVGAEALVRWQDAGRGIVAPGEFIPVAEELGLIEAIGEWVLDSMAHRQRGWSDAGLGLDVSFNLSPRQLWAPHLAEKILSTLHEAGVAPQSIVVEITESIAMADPDRTQKILAELRAWGVRLALDDFGTGYSSLARLKHMPVDVLKIDREFVRNVDRDVRLAGMVRAMIQVAQSLDMVPLAEGVETEGEYVFLRSNGCRLAQGFWFSHPVPADRIPELAARRSLIPGMDEALRR
jgi:diguanylate cyclase (GGDEF)-like protein/PAS domain S-box-containing protein